MRYSRRYILLTLLLAIIVVAEFRKFGQSYEAIGKFRGASIEKSTWNPMIAKNINSKNIALNIDNREYSNKKDGIYMNEDLELMLPVNMLRESLNCSARIYEGTQLHMEKYNDEIEMGLKDPIIRKNGEKTEIETPLTEVEGQYYIPVKAVSESLGFSYQWDVEKNTGTVVNTVEAASYLPLSYDLREKQRVSVVKDQGRFGTCWAFAALTALESSLRPEEVYEFSPDHMSMNNSFQSNQNDGGEYTMGMAYLMSWQGPVLEEQDPYGDGVTTPGLSAVRHVQEAQILAEKDLNAIKDAVFKYGGVQTSIYSSMQSSQSESEYYNREKYAYCYKGTEKPNHDVVIVGWDDQYPKENFSTELEGDGAFICQNSWGESFGEDGYFYVSYYDNNIGIHNVVYTKIEASDNYDQIYQSDLCGWVGQMGYNSDTIYGANVFTAQADQDLKAAGIYATGADTSYEVYVVKKFKDVGSLRSGIKVAEGKVKNAGYYTIPFEQPMPVQAQERFAIVVKIETPGSTLPIAIEYAADEATQGVDLTDGEGYISRNGGTNWDHVEETQQCNLCIKAYSVNR